MIPSLAFSTAVVISINLWLSGLAIALPEVELPPEEVPSLYWASQRFGRVSFEDSNGERIEENAIIEWKALTSLREMRVLVSDIWSQLPYDGRYRLVQGLGDVAARKGFSLSIVDLSNTLLATYSCEEEPLRDEPLENEPQESRLVCTIDLNPPPIEADPAPRL